MIEESRVVVFCVYDRSFERSGSIESLKSFEVV